MTINQIVSVPSHQQNGNRQLSCQSQYYMMSAMTRKYIGLWRENAEPPRTLSSDTYHL
jgi:hypothetical protein